MMHPALDMSDAAVYRGVRRVLAIDRLVIERGEIVSIIGLNGAGKSTLLQAASTLLPCHMGSIRLFGEPVSKANQLRLRRRSALLFQEAVFTRDTVFNNVALPLKLRGYKKADIEMRVLQALKTVRCEHLISRQAHQVSGGEAQRVNLARALAADPEFLLLDEPFSALDPAARLEMLAEFHQIIVDRGLTALIVSHTMQDVLFLSERTIVLEDGCIVQEGKPEDIMRRPASERVARLVGVDNILPCQVENVAGSRVIALNETVKIPYAGQPTSHPSFCCFPGDIFSVADTEKSAKASNGLIEGVVQRVIPGIGVYQLALEAGGTIVHARLPRQQALAMAIPGKKLSLVFDPQDIQLV